MKILSKRFTYEVGFYGLLSIPATDQPERRAVCNREPRLHSTGTAPCRLTSQVSCLEKTSAHNRISPI